MKDPPNVGKGIVVRCDNSVMQKIDSTLTTWASAISRVKSDESKVGSAAANIAALYKRYYPTPQAAFFSELSSAINGTGGLIPYMTAIQNDISKAKGCIWNNAYIKKGCRHIPQDCFDEGALFNRVHKVDEAITALAENMEAHEHILPSGLRSNNEYRMGNENHPVIPSGCVHHSHDGQGWHWHGCSPVSCGSSQPLCQQHMRYTIQTFIRTQNILLEKLEQ